jgi:tRNA(Ile)-lysidine synthase TilS/MesJ
LPQNKKNIQICKKCILPVTFPGIKFDDQGICNYCRRQESAAAKVPDKKEKYQKRLDHLVNDIKGKAPVYDAIMAYSGGKDSSYTLQLLAERYDLRLVALTFDNHFVSQVAMENIKKVTDALEIDHICFRPPWQFAKELFVLTAKEDIFPAPTLLRASSICTACIGIVKSLVLKTALEMSIPLVAFGWSPGQAPIQSAILKTNSALIRHNQSALSNALPPEIKRTMDKYLITELYYERYKDRFPYNIHPLAFFHYDEEHIKNELNELGWQAPTDTDTNSSNCLLNAFANHCHLERNQFHPYVWEIANMVRQGVVNRDQGIERIYSEQNRNMVDYAKKRLDI